MQQSLHVPRGSVVQMVNFLLSEALQQDASDVHIEALAAQIRVRFRVDGVLYSVAELPFQQKDELVSRIKIMAGLDITEKRRPQDGRIAFADKGRKIDLRVSTLPTAFGEKVVMRLLEQDKEQLSLTQLGVHPSSLHIIQKIIQQPYGMVLITGPTGSGKSTSLYALLQQLNQESQNLLTIEDPIEYQMEGINQVQVKPEIGFGFSEALRSFLRQDPDVIMVGEIRDTETAEIAIRASLTGHLLLSTLHTNDAASAISRLVDMGIAPFLVSASLKLVIAQRLVRSICPHCKIAHTPTPEELQLLPEAKDIPCFIGEGCPSCKGRGYKGRIGVFEMLVVDKTLAEGINKGWSAAAIKNYALQNGFQSLSAAALSHLAAGNTSLQEITQKLVMEG
jgi:type II secretory ATPase GspE/PulE/Tfp pilus assembly ATPase PilB-like protein